MKQQKNKKALNEVLNYSNIEIISYLLRLSKLVKAFEGIIWENAQQKARKLIYENNAIQYIDSVREQLTPKVSPIEVKQDIEDQEPIELEKPKITPPVILENSTLNYQALIDLAPDLLTRIIQKGRYYGIARKRGYKEISLELLTKDRTGYYFQLISHKNNVGDGVYIQFDFHLDSVNERIEMLAFTDKNGSVEVYQSRTKRTTVTTKERKDQNAYLFARLTEFTGWELSFNSEKSPQRIEQKKRKKIKDQQTKKQQEIDEFRININKQIPDFKVGKVQMLEVYKNLGIDQDFIDYVNHKKLSVHLIVVKEKNDTNDKRIGFEFTPTGKIYFTGKYLKQYADYTPSKGFDNCRHWFQQLQKKSA